jgi:hypothetical protein
MKNRRGILHAGIAGLSGLGLTSIRPQNTAASTQPRSGHRTAGASLNDGYRRPRAGGAPN